MDDKVGIAVEHIALTGNTNDSYEYLGVNTRAAEKPASHTNGVSYYTMAIYAYRQHIDSQEDNRMNTSFMSSLSRMPHPYLFPNFLIWCIFVSKHY